MTWARSGTMEIFNGLTARFSAASPADAGLMALKKMSLMLRQQALTLSYDDVLTMMAMAFFLALPMTLLLTKPSPQGGGGH